MIFVSMFPVLVSVCFPLVSLLYERKSLLVSSPFPCQSLRFPFPAYRCETRNDRESIVRPYEETCTHTLNPPSRRKVFRFVIARRFLLACCLCLVLYRVASSSPLFGAPVDFRLRDAGHFLDRPAKPLSGFFAFPQFDLITHRRVSFSRKILDCNGIVTTNQARETNNVILMARGEVIRSSLFVRVLATIVNEKPCFIPAFVESSDLFGSKTE